MVQTETKNKAVQSTRNASLTASPSMAVLQGIAPDGGLYILPSFDSISFDWEKTLSATTLEIAEMVLNALLPDYGKEAMHELVEKAYRNKFETDELTPLVRAGEKNILELFRGPTSAFKDVALSMLPQLVGRARVMNDQKEEIVILTATSGDTGKAALEGFHDVEGTKIIVFFPENGVSAIQKKQMTTQEGGNVYVCGINGNFDDAQTGVKEIFARVREEGLLEGKNAVLSSANSINIGRLCPQVVYYFKAYADLVRQGRIQKGEAVNFTVPTGNFGDILAGFFAMKMGLPVDKFICASNANNVLTDFFKTGTYDKNRPFHQTISPSMDILVSSNLERLLYLLSDGDTALVSSCMKDLNEKGKYTVPKALFDKMGEKFRAGFCDDKTCKETIRKTFEEDSYLADPHTAVAIHVAEEFDKSEGKGVQNVILSTASPYKFSAAVLEALGMEVPADEFEGMKLLEEKSGVKVPHGLATLQNKPILHRDVIEKNEMMAYVLSKISEK